MLTIARRAFLMGLEESVIAKKSRRSFEGKLHVDSKKLEFRGKELKWSVELKSKMSAKAVNGRLVVDCGRQQISFNVDSPEKWVSKILNPPSLMKKLGVKPEQRCFVSRGFGKSFKDEIRSAGGKIVRSTGPAELLFLHIGCIDELSNFDDIATQLDAGVNIWVVWPKGSKQIGQSDVMNRAKSLGFGPSKTASIDENSSSMRFAKRKA